MDGYYEHSFEIWLAVTVVFPGAGNLGFTLLGYRLGQRSLFDSLVENLTWVPFLCVFRGSHIFWFVLTVSYYNHSFFFFGGLSIHLSQALLAHLFSYNISWGATKKEVERSNFWLEVPKILKRFWLALVLSILLCVVMIIFTTGLIPEGWRISSWDWAVIFPLAWVTTPSIRGIATDSALVRQLGLSQGATFFIRYAFSLCISKCDSYFPFLYIDCAQSLAHDILLLI